MRDEFLALGIGLIYIGAVFWREPLLHAILRVPLVITPEYLHVHGTSHVIALAAVRLPAFLLLCYAVFRNRESPLRRSLRPSRVPNLAKAALLTVVVSFFLNAVSVWPFTWRWAEDPTATYVQTLLVSNNWLGVSIWAVVAIVIVPLVEEVVFRFGVLRLVLRYGCSPWAAVFGSSLLFGIAHLGYAPIWEADLQHLVNALWVFAFSLLLGWLTLRRDGNITLPITIHVARNATELVLLLVALP